MTRSHTRIVNDQARFPNSRRTYCTSTDVDHCWARRCQTGTIFTNQTAEMRQMAFILLGALAVLVVTAPLVSAQCPENPDDCQFQYTNIRLESSTPSIHSVYNPEIPGDVITSPPPSDSVILDEVAVVAEEPTNPFSNVDLSSFSDEDLETRRELLLAILEQTNADLGIAPPTKGARSAPVAPVDPVDEDMAVINGEDDTKKYEIKGMDTVVETTDDVILEGSSDDVVLAGGDSSEDAVVETDDVVVETETEEKPEDIASVTEEVSASFFKKLIGGSSPSSSASTTSVVAGVLALLMVLL